MSLSHDLSLILSVSNISLLSFQQINSTLSQDGEQNGLLGRVDEGVDEFFSKKVTKMDSK